MVEDEKRRYRPSKNYLEHLPPLNITSFEVSNRFINSVLTSRIYSECKYLFRK